MGPQGSFHLVGVGSLWLLTCVPWGLLAAGLSLKQLQVVGRLLLLTAGVQKELLPQGGDGLLL